MAMAEARSFKERWLAKRVKQLAEAVGETSGNLSRQLAAVERFIRGLDDAMVDAGHYEEARRCLAGELYGWVPMPGEISDGSRWQQRPRCRTGPSSVAAMREFDLTYKLLGGPMTRDDSSL
jgi:hypothetical protein